MILNIDKNTDFESPFSHCIKFTCPTTKLKSIKIRLLQHQHYGKIYTLYTATRDWKIPRRNVETPADSGSSFSQFCQSLATRSLSFLLSPALSLFVYFHHIFTFSLYAPHSLSLFLVLYLSLSLYPIFPLSLNSYHSLSVFFLFYFSLGRHHLFPFCLSVPRHISLSLSLSLSRSLSFPISLSRSLARYPTPCLSLSLHFSFSLSLAFSLSCSNTICPPPNPLSLSIHT